MQVDRGAFLMFVTTLALGGGAGYVASEKDLVPHLSGKALPPPPSTPSAALPVDAGVPVAVVVDAGPSCDDDHAEAEPCPSIGLPTVEGGCGAFPQTRCHDFQQTMKPRVAKAAVACLNKLNGAERCDPKRVDLCAHLALMNACDDRAATASSDCDAIVDACAKSPVVPSKSECRAAMSGLREIGREAVVECAKKHCFDKGIIGCEASPVGKP